MTGLDFIYSFYRNIEKYKNTEVDYVTCGGGGTISAVLKPCMHLM